MATQVFLHDLTARAEASRQSLRQEAEALKRHENVVFALMVASALVSIVLVVSGMGLIVANLLAVGSLSEVVALLSGGGSVWLRRLQQDTGRRREELSRQETEESRIVSAMGVALMIPDEEKRNEAMANLASTLTSSLLSGAPKSQTR